MPPLMPVHDLSLCRSLLFLPASNPRAIAKARKLSADLIILDLEDAVRPEDKAEARAAAVEAAAVGFGGRPIAIRVNAAGSPHHGDDMIAVRRSRAQFAIVPKAERVRDLHDAHAVTERPVIAMIETPLAVLDCAGLARHAAALIAGTNDLSAELRIPPASGREGLTHALQQIVLAARAAGIPAFDGVHNRLEDGAALAAESRQGRAFGFDGKSVIHPSQIETVNRCFTPSDAELDAAAALIASAGGGAERHEGRMIEAMHVAQARSLLAKARPR